MLTVGAVVLNFKAAGGFPQRLLDALLLPISGTLTARFILRLRALTTTLLGSSPTHPASSTPTAFSSLRIARRSALSRSRSFADEFGDDLARAMPSSEHPHAITEGGEEKDCEHATPDEESPGYSLAPTN